MFCAARECRRLSRGAEEQLESGIVWIEFPGDIEFDYHRVGLHCSILANTYRERENLGALALPVPIATPPTAARVDDRVHPLRARLTPPHQIRLFNAPGGAADRRGAPGLPASPRAASSPRFESSLISFSRAVDNSAISRLRREQVLHEDRAFALGFVQAIDS